MSASNEICEETVNGYKAEISQWFDKVEDEIIRLVIDNNLGELKRNPPTHSFICPNRQTAHNIVGEIRSKVQHICPSGVTGAVSDVHSKTLFGKVEVVVTLDIRKG